MSKLGVDMTNPGAMNVDAEPALTWLDPATAFDPGRWKELDKTLKSSLNETARKWYTSSTESARKKNMPSELDDQHGLRSAKHLVKSLAGKMPAGRLTDPEDQHAISNQLLAYARSALSEKVDEHQILDLLDLRRGELYVAGLALLASDPEISEWEFLVENADRIGHARLAYLAEIDVTAWTSKSESVTPGQIVRLATCMEFAQVLKVVVSLSGPPYGFELGRLVAVAHNRRSGLSGLEAVLANFESLKKNLLDAGYEDVAQLPRTGITPRSDPSLRNRILHIAAQGATAIRGFVNNYDRLRSLGIDGMQIVRSASASGTLAALTALAEHFPVLKTIAENGGMRSDDAREAIVKVAIRGGRAQAINALRDVFTTLTQAPYHFLPAEILAMAQPMGGGATLRSLIGPESETGENTSEVPRETTLFEELCAGLERENYPLRTEAAIAKDSNDSKDSKREIQQILSAVGSRGGGKNALWSLRDYLARREDERKFPVEVAVAVLSRNGAGGLLGAEKYMSILKAQPYSLPESDIHAIARTGGYSALKTLTEERAYEELQNLLTNAGYTVDDAARAIVKIASRTGSATTLKAVIKGLRDLTVPPFSLQVADVLYIGAVHGGHFTFTALRMHYTTLRAEPYCLSHDLILRVVKRSGGGGALMYLLTNFRILTGEPFRLKPKDMVRVLSGGAGVPAIETLRRNFTLLTREPYGLRPDDAVRVAARGGSRALFALIDLHGILTTDPFNLQSAQLVRIAADYNGGSALRSLKDSFRILTSAPCNLEPDVVARIAATRGGGAALFALVELHGILTGPPYSMSYRELTRIAISDGAAGKLLAYVKDDPTPEASRAAARVAAVIEGQNSGSGAEGDEEQIEQQSTSMTVEGHDDDDMPDADEPSPVMTAAALKRGRTSGPNSGSRRRQRVQARDEPASASAGSPVGPARLRQLAIGATPPPTGPAPALPMEGIRDVQFQKVLEAVQDYRPELNTRFFARDLKNPDFVDPRFALPGDPTRVDPQWKMTELFVHPDYGLNGALASLPVIDDDRLFRKYGRNSAREDCLRKDILPAVEQELEATRSNRESAASRYYTVDRLTESDMPGDPEKLLGRVGDWGVFANMQELEKLAGRRQDFAVLGIYAGAGIRNNEENEDYYEAVGLGDARAKLAAAAGPEAYEQYLTEARLKADKGRFLVHAYEMAVPAQPGSGLEDVAFQGAIGGNAMARINTAITRDPADPDTLVFDEDGVNTMMLPLLSHWEHEGTGKTIDGEPLMAIVASIPHVRHHFKDHELPRVQFMLNYGEEHVDAHMNSYRLE